MSVDADLYEAAELDGANKFQQFKHIILPSIKTIVIFFGLCAVVPVISCIITAFKTDTEYAQTNVMTLPENWLNFDNFVKAFTTANMGRAFLNSLIVMVSVLLVSVIIGTQLAYVLNRFKFVGNGLIRNLFLFASLLPALLVFILCQKQIYSGIAAGAVKG